MKTNIENLFGTFRNVRRFDVWFKTKRYRNACDELSNFLSQILFPGGQVFFCYKNNSIFCGDIEIIQVDPILFFCDNFELFKNKLQSYKDTVFRSFVRNFFFDCENSETPLEKVDIDFTNDFKLENTKFTKRSGQIKNFLEQEDINILTVCGNSSSGKTISVAQAVDQLKDKSYSYTWIDLVKVNVEIEHLVYSIFQTFTENNHIIIIDNVQAYPSKVQRIKEIIDYVNNNCKEANLKVIYICWWSAYQIVKEVYSSTSIKKVECSGDDIITELIREYKLDKYETEIQKNSAGDVLVAKSMIDFVIQFNQFPTEEQLSQTMYDECTKNSKLSTNAQNILHILAALGEFEIHVRQEYLQKISPEGYLELLNNKVFRTYKTEDGNVYVTIGHRSLAHKILVYLRKKLNFEISPVDLAIKYLNIEGEKQILSTLERLSLELEVGDSSFANLWKAFCNMRASLIKQLGLDPTWGNNMASMIFAAEALTNMKFDADSVKMWATTASNIRKRWAPDSNNGIVFIGDNENIKYTTEIVDFTENIRKTMEADEKTYSYAEDMLSKNIDYQRFHDNWLLGLLLGFEGICLDNCSDLKAKYIVSAEKMQQPNGSFYPKRVCWVTARVIMGLCQCGFTYFSDSVVKKACDWLVGELFDKKSMGWALDCCGWRSGTGTWNSNEQITLMCLCALFSAQYPIKKKEKVSKIVKEIWRCRENLEKSFIEKGNILDIMWIIDVMLFDNRNPIELKDEIKNLTEYVIGKWNKASSLSSEKETESSDVSFMTKELIFIVWALLKKNLEQLLKGFELDYSISSEKKKIFISYRRVEGGGSLFAQALYNLLNKSFKNEVFLDVVDLEDQCDEFNDILEQALDNSKVVIAIVSDYAFNRACFSDYDNSSDVYYKELSEALKKNKKVITIYNKTIELPEALKVNKDFYNVAERLAKKNALFYDSSIPGAIEKLAAEVVKKINYLNI